jgi:quinol monooxygenase YgiN
VREIITSVRMGLIVIAAFRPKPGKEEKLRDVLRDHVPLLRREGLITDRPSCVMKARDGTYLEIFEWKSQDAIDAAHENGEVATLWARFEAASECVNPGLVVEFNDLFPHFEPVEL